MTAPNVEGSGSFREDREGWISIRIEGAPYDRGFQHGTLLAPELTRALREIRFLFEHDTGVSFEWLCRNAEAMYGRVLPGAADGFGDEVLDELRGIADGANDARPADEAPITLADLLGWNGYPELACQWWPAVLSHQIEPDVPLPWTHAAPAHPAPRPALSAQHFHHSCSAFVATGDSTADGGIVAAHTTWQRFANGDAYNVILDLAPDRGHRMVMQSVPGYVYSSTDFGVTAGGLVVTETSLNVAGFDPKGLPEWFRARRASQFADSIESWRDLFREGNNGGYVNSWLLGETATGRIAAYELTLKHHRLLPVLDSGFYAGCNIPLDPTIRALTGGGAGDWDNVLGSAGRRIRWDALMEKFRGRLDARSAREALGDHHDEYLAADTPSSRTICGHLDNDDMRYGGSHQAPWYPWGSLDGKATTATRAAELEFDARWGRACGLPLDVPAFLDRHPQYDWLRGHMLDRPTRPWIGVGGAPGLTEGDRAGREADQPA